MGGHCPPYAGFPMQKTIKPAKRLCLEPCEQIVAFTHSQGFYAPGMAATGRPKGIGAMNFFGPEQ